jgi:hypothetical protein
MNKISSTWRRTTVAVTLGVASVMFAGCTTTTPADKATSAEKRQELNAAANACTRARRNPGSWWNARAACWYFRTCLAPASS